MILKVSTVPSFKHSLLKEIKIPRILEMIEPVHRQKKSVNRTTTRYLLTAIVPWTLSSPFKAERHYRPPDHHASGKSVLKTEVKRKTKPN